MYEKFFSLDELPFDGLPDERFFYVGGDQRAALELLTEHLSRQGVICVLEGSSGSGKTTLVRMLMRALPARMRIIAIDDPRLSPHMLLATILRASGVAASSMESIAELTFKFRTMLDKEDPLSSGVTVIVDEAQGLSDDSLEQIRLLSNIEGSSGRKFNFLLVGQQELTERIRSPRHSMFYSRVKAFAAVHALKRDELLSYVSFRLQQAGCHSPLFSSEAITALHKGSKGLPRLINSIADQALLLSFNAGKKTVSAGTVKRATSLVRTSQKSFKVRMQNLRKCLKFTLMQALPWSVFGAGLAVASFAAAYFLLPNVIKSSSVEAAADREAVVREATDELLRARLASVTPRGRALKLFYTERQNSVFQSDAVASLIGLWGYARADGATITCDDLAKTSIYCVTARGSLDDAVRTGRPAVLSMADETLTPYYALLVQADPKADSAEIMLGRHLFAVKKEFLKAQFSGEYLSVLPELEDHEEIPQKMKREELSLLIGHYERALNLKPGSLKDRNSLLKARDAFAFRHPEEETRDLVWDLSSATGPYLFKKGEYGAFVSHLASSGTSHEERSK